MDLSQNPILGPALGLGEANQRLAPDWRGLQARFAAAHAARRELLGIPVAGGAAGGGFTLWRTERNETSYPVVNQTHRANGKADSFTIPAIAGPPRTGDRGTK